MRNPFKDNKKFLQSEYNKSFSQRIREARQGQGKRGVVSTALFIIWLIAVNKGYGGGGIDINIDIHYLVVCCQIQVFL